MESSESKQFLAVSYKLGNKKSAIRHLFVKKHEGKDPQKPSDRTLFILNVPQYFNQKCMKFYYEHCGEIERILMQEKPKSVSDDNVKGQSSVFLKQKPSIGYKVAYIVFKQPISLLTALKCKDLPGIPLKKLNTCIGFNKWIRDYNSSFIDIPSVQKEIDIYMENYDKQLEEEKLKSKELDIDEDGWVTVTKYSKKPKISRKEEVSRKILEKQKKESEKKMLLNFYRCQLRDKKMEEIVELRKKFEKDKKHIALMKENRKFKPF